MGGAVIHASHFLHAGGRDMINALAGTPRFLAKKVLRLPHEVVILAKPPGGRAGCRPRNG